MHKKSITIFLACILSLSCTDHERHEGIATLQADNSGTFKKEIPLIKEGSKKGDTVYQLKDIRQAVADLGMDNLEKGFKGIQIRVWLGHSLAIQKTVVILKQVNTHWNAEVVTYTDSLTERQESIYRLLARNVSMTPVSGWDSLISRIADWKIMSLPNGDDLPGYTGCGGADGITYLVEAATASSYRLYYYCNSPLKNSPFWQERNLMEFVQFLENEFGFTFVRG